MGGYTATEARQRWNAAQGRVAFDYDEAKHPRDEHGRWGAGGQVWEASGKPSYWQTPTEMRAEIDQFDRLPADTRVRLFHGTTADNADGIVATKRAGYEPRADTVSTGSQHHGLYVAPTFDDAKSYAGPGGKVVEMLVARGDVVPSPEARNKTVGEALYHSFEGAVLRDGAKIDPVAVHDPVRARAARLSARARVAFGFDEAEHPRDEKGRFGDGGGSSVQPEAWQLAEPPSSSLPWAEQQAIRDQVTDAQNEYGAAHISEAGRTAFQGDSPEAQALRGYTIGDYHQVSAALRGQSGSVTDASTNKAFSTVGEQIAALDRGVAQGVVTNDMVVFRGAGNWAGGDLTPGSVVKDAGFVSTSLSREVAAGFNGPTFEITVPAGTHAAFTNANVYKVFHEAEVILPRDQSFVVTGQEGNVTRMTLK